MYNVHYKVTSSLHYLYVHQDYTSVYRNLQTQCIFQRKNYDIVLFFFFNAFL